MTLLPFGTAPTPDATTTKKGKIKLAQDLGGTSALPTVVFANDTLHLLKASNLSDVASASTSRTNLGLGTMATQAASAVAITGGTINGITKIGVNTTPATNIAAAFQSPASFVPSQTMSYTAGNNFFTTSSSMTLYEGDIVFSAAADLRSRQITATNTGTTFHVDSFPIDSTNTAQAFTVYRPALRIFDDTGALLADFRPQISPWMSGIFVGDVCETNESHFNLENGMWIHWSNAAKTGISYIMSANNGVISFGSGFAMGNQGISDLSNIAGVNNQNFDIFSFGTGILRLSPSQGAGVQIFGGSGTKQLEVNSTGVAFNGTNAIAKPGATTDLGVVLSNLGLRTAGTAYPITTSGAVALTGTFTVTSMAATAGITSSGPTGAGIGYATGAGGTVTQITSRSTGVTINKLTGTITGDSTSLAAKSFATFTVTNSAVAIGDTIILSVQSGPTANTSIFTVAAVAAGSFDIKISNISSTTADTGAPIINFAVIKAVSA